MKEDVKLDKKRKSSRFYDLLLQHFISWFNDITIIWEKQVTTV